LHSLYVAPIITGVVGGVLLALILLKLGLSGEAQKDEKRSAPSTASAIPAEPRVTDPSVDKEPRKKPGAKAALESPTELLKQIQELQEEINRLKAEREAENQKNGEPERKREVESKVKQQQEQKVVVYYRCPKQITKVLEKTKCKDFLGRLDKLGISYRVCWERQFDRELCIGFWYGELSGWSSLTADDNADKERIVNRLKEVKGVEVRLVKPDLAELD
jgi:hypothetical protein